MSCGFTATISTSATAAASSVSTPRTPYLAVSSATRSGYRSVNSSDSGERPAPSSPASMASPILPAPRMAIVVMAIRVPRLVRPVRARPGRSGPARRPGSGAARTPGHALGHRRSGGTPRPPGRPGRPSGKPGTDPSRGQGRFHGSSTSRCPTAAPRSRICSNDTCQRAIPSTCTSTSVSTLSISTSVSPMPSSGRELGLVLRLSCGPSTGRPPAPAATRDARRYKSQFRRAMKRERGPPPPGGAMTARDVGVHLPGDGVDHQLDQDRLAGDVRVERHGAARRAARRSLAWTAPRSRRHRPARSPRRRWPGRSGPIDPAGPAAPTAAQGSVPDRSSWRAPALLPPLALMWRIGPSPLVVVDLKSEY